MSRKAFLGLMVALAGTACGEPPSPMSPNFSVTASPYTVTDIGTLGGGSSVAMDVNDNEQIVGQSGTEAGETHAFLHADGVMRDLGTLGGTFSTADDINAAGQAAGRSTTGTGEMRAVLWTNGAAADLGPVSLGRVYLSENGQVAWTAPLPGGGSQPARWSDGTIQELGTLGGTFATAAGINDHGAVVGTSTTADGSSGSKAFVWHDGVMTALADLGRNSQANAINTAGQIVGSALDEQNFWHAVLWENGEMTDLGTLPGDKVARSVALNELGWVAGESLSWQLDDSSAPFRWQGGRMIALDRDYATSSSRQRVSGINMRGLVVGSESFPGSLPRVEARAWNNGFVWDLGGLGGRSTVAVAVNVPGTIVGRAQLPNSAVTRAVVWHVGSGSGQH